MSHFSSGRPKRASPLRNVSFASTSSSEHSPPPVEVPPPNFNYNAIAGHKRGNSERSPERAPSENRHPTKSSLGQRKISNGNRQSLRTLAQAPVSLLPSPPHAMEYQSRNDMLTSNSASAHKIEVEPLKKKPCSIAISRSGSRRGPPPDISGRHDHQNGVSHHSAAYLESSDLEKLSKSSTSHLRALSKLGDEADFQITSPEQEVVGMHGRRRLQRNMSTRGKKPSTTPGYGGKIWMDQQRQFLQAYEYLCHIGEAKEWIEDIINKPIPPVVQLEEALRDGVTLAEVVQALTPNKTFRIFQNPRLQFRHSDNIAIFFRYLSDVELPELFRFELVDLYEKKNIPKVIYCIHALSWLLFRQGIVGFRIGNLVGKLEFEDHELEAMQKGLDKAGVSMPNFSGMGANFGAEPTPEPEPVETEEDRINRELAENEANIVELQAQLRGASRRIKLGDFMEELYNNEHLIQDLQARIRGDFARQISEYRLSMKNFSTDLQRFARGFLARSREQGREEFWKSREPDVILLQSLVRSRKVRAETQNLKSTLAHHEHGIRQLQALARGNINRNRLAKQERQTKQASAHLPQFQAFIRGHLSRAQGLDVKRSLNLSERSISALQGQVRGALLRRRLDGDHVDLHQNMAQLERLQAMIRARSVQDDMSSIHAQLDHTCEAIVTSQAAFRGYILRTRSQDTARALQNQSKHVTQLQGLSRAYLVRSNIYQQLCALKRHDAELRELQAIARAALCRARIEDDLASLEAEEPSIISFQARIRGGLIRRRFADKKRHFDQNMNKVIKLQSFVRAKQQGEAYKSLMSGKNPPVGTVKNFVHLLNDSDFDFEEEIESERVRKSVVLRVRQNESMEQYIEELDTKIGLVQNLKNRRDELVRLQKHHGGHMSQLLTTNMDVSKNTLNFKALNKNSRHRVEQYQELFFFLQTQPQYLARFFKRARERGASDEEMKRLEMLTMSMFGFAQKRREEYFLLKLITRAMKEEADACGSMQEFQRGTFFWSRLFGYYTRAPKDRKFLRELLGPYIRTRIVDCPDLDLESDPLQIHRNNINNEQLRTGQRSAKDPDLTREEAIREPETRAIFVHHLQDIRDLCDIFLATFEETIQRMPYTIRYAGQQMFEILTTKFPREDKAQVLQAVGSWLWRTYLKPALSDPETFGVTDRGLSFAHKRNLAEFTKVMNQIASGKVFGNENDCLKPLNSYVTEAINHLQSIWAQALDVKDAETQFDIDEFNDLYARTKPTLFIKLADVFAIHQTIAAEISSLCTSHEDNVLRDLIQELGNPKANEVEMMAGSSMEITLQLSPKLHNLDDPDGPIKTIFMETKRCVLYIIRIQTGENLLGIMVKPVTAEDEQRWAALVRDEVAAEGRKGGAYSEGKSLIDIASLTYSELKRTALENILQLEQSHRISRSNNYQDLLNEIALDIRTKHRRRVQRQRELEGARATLANLLEKSVWLEEKLKAYNDAFEQNLTTLQNKKGKKRFLMPFSKQWDHERELARMGKIPEFGSYRYSGYSLWEKGILVDWRGVNLRENDIIFSSDEIGVFHIDGASGSMMIPGASARFTWDDMLAAGYNNEQYVTFFKDCPGAGELRLNANLLQTQISKKFWRND